MPFVLPFVHSCFLPFYHHSASVLDTIRSTILMGTTRSGGGSVLGPFCHLPPPLPATTTCHHSGLPFITCTSGFYLPFYRYHCSTTDGLGLPLQWGSLHYLHLVLCSGKRQITILVHSFYSFILFTDSSSTFILPFVSCHSGNDLGTTIHSLFIRHFIHSDRWRGLIISSTIPIPAFCSWEEEAIPRIWREVTFWWEAYHSFDVQA